MNRIYILHTRELAIHRDDAFALLSEERRRKVLAQHNETDALRSLGAGLLLRRFVGDGPMAYGEFGKPFLPGALPFSLSHGGDLVVLAVGEKDSELGVDVEKLDRPWREAVARRFFTPEEQEWLGNSSERFFHLWTRKEAVLKCRGSGLSRLARFSVQEDCLELHDANYALSTFIFDGHCISLAVHRAPATASICMINVQSVL